MNTDSNVSQEASNSDVVLAQNKIEVSSFLESSIEFMIGGPLLITNKKGFNFEQAYEDRYVTGKTSGIKKQKRNPEQEWEDALHVISSKNNEYGFPAVGLKELMVYEFKNSDISMKEARQIFYVDGPCSYDPIDKTIPPKSGLFPILTFEGDKNGFPLKRRDFVIRNGKTPDLEYRREFRNWTAKVRVVFNSSRISSNTITTVLRNAGKRGGLGSGRFHIPQAGVFKIISLSDVETDAQDLNFHKNVKVVPNSKSKSKSKSTPKSEPGRPAKTGKKK